MFDIRISKAVEQNNHYSINSASFIITAVFFQTMFNIYWVTKAGERDLVKLYTFIKNIWFDISVFFFISGL